MALKLAAEPGDPGGLRSPVLKLISFRSPTGPKKPGQEALRKQKEEREVSSSVSLLGLIQHQQTKLLKPPEPLFSPRQESTGLVYGLSQEAFTASSRRWNSCCQSLLGFTKLASSRETRSHHTVGNPLASR